MPWRKIFGWAALIFVVWYVVTNPTGAADAAHGLLGMLKSAGTSLATFFNSL